MSMTDAAFIPATREEAAARGWHAVDIVIVTGDAYVDSPFIGAAVIARVLEAAGFRVGIIAQPDTGTSHDITRFGEPRLFWGVTAGALDSMVANFTASGKRRRDDDLTAGGINRRPDRACIVYANLIRRYFKQTRPIVLGGLEASMRRMSHYDVWDNAVRRSVLVDAKADVLVYGMGEQAVVEIARRLDGGRPIADVPGTCVLERTPRAGYEIVPGHDQVATDHRAFNEAFRAMHAAAEPGRTCGLCQQQDTRWLVHHPPQPPLHPRQLDALYELPYRHDAHPSELVRGPVKALDTIRCAITTHRGCFGDCSFCTIAAHQGRTVVSRTEESILREVETMTRRPGFTGIISDVGGPTANMYGMGCTAGHPPCVSRRCTYPEPCPRLNICHDRIIRLLSRIRAVPGVRKAFVASGVRHDLVIADARDGKRYLRELAAHHISGQLKIAPEHTEERVLRLMGKPGPQVLRTFKRWFDHANREGGTRWFLTYYFIAAHPGCDETAMRSAADFIRRELHISPEQVQVFTPLPGTRSAAMYHTGMEPDSGERIFVERTIRGALRQKAILGAGRPQSGTRTTPGQYQPRTERTGTRRRARGRRGKHRT